MGREVVNTSYSYSNYLWLVLIDVLHMLHGIIIGMKHNNINRISAKEVIASFCLRLICNISYRAHSVQSHTCININFAQESMLALSTMHWKAAKIHYRWQ